jgi:nicotinamidase/pyrazinamidase
MTTQLETFDTVVAINVDVQNDFCPGGSLSVPAGDQVVAPLNNLNRWVRDKTGLVVFTRDHHPEETTHFDKWPRHCVQFRAGAAFHEDLELIDPTEHFDGPGRDLIVSKGMGKDEDGYSGMEATAAIASYDGRSFTGTAKGSMDEILFRYMIGNYPGAFDHNTREQRPVYNSMAIIIGGLATEYCDRATALDAVDFSRENSRSFGRKIGVYAVTDAMRGVDLQPGDSAHALHEMYETGVILTTTEDITSGRVMEVAR